MDLPKVRFLRSINLKGGWNVPENVVVSVSFFPKHKRRIASPKLDPKKFKKEIGKHVGGVIYYINDEEGITYEVQEGKLTPSSMDRQKNMTICIAAIPLIRNQRLVRRK